MVEVLSFSFAVPRRWRRCQGQRREQAGAITPDNVPLAVRGRWRQLESPVTLRTINFRGWLQRASFSVVHEQGVSMSEAHRPILEPCARLHDDARGVVDVEAVAQIPPQLAVIALDPLVRRWQ